MSRTAIAVVVLLAFTATAAADIIHLKSGETFHGTRVSKPVAVVEIGVVYRLDNGKTRWVASDDIELIEPDPPTPPPGATLRLKPIKDTPSTATSTATTYCSRCKRCEACKGTGRFDCPKCSGLGSTKCSPCRGAGHIVRTQPIDDGKSAVKWEEVKIDCVVCNARGIIPCQACKERGYNPCVACDGCGWHLCASCRDEREEKRLKSRR